LPADAQLDAELGSHLDAPLDAQPVSDRGRAALDYQPDMVIAFVILPGFQNLYPHQLVELNQARMVRAIIVQAVLKALHEHQAL
jgi:hypothetical protein